MLPAPPPAPGRPWAEVGARSEPHTVDPETSASKTGDQAAWLSGQESRRPGISASLASALGGGAGCTLDQRFEESPAAVAKGRPAGNAPPCGWRERKMLEQRALSPPHQWRRQSGHLCTGCRCRCRPARPPPETASGSSSGRGQGHTAVRAALQQDLESRIDLLRFAALPLLIQGGGAGQNHFE